MICEKCGRELTDRDQIYLIDTWILGFDALNPDIPVKFTFCQLCGHEALGRIFEYVNEKETYDR